MGESSILAAIWVVTVLLFFVLYHRMESGVQQERLNMLQERAEWVKERKDLLDRIQAPTFTDYANKVVREKKAEKTEELKEDHYDQFIS